MKPILSFFLGILCAVPLGMFIQHRINGGPTDQRMASEVNSSPSPGPVARPGLEVKMNEATTAAPQSPEGVAQGIRDILQMRRVTERANALAQLLDAVGAQGMSSFVDQVCAMGLSANGRFSILKAAFRSWAESDPTAAAAKFALLTRTDQLTVVDVLAEAWAASDPSSALKWAKDLPPSKARVVAIGQCFAELGRTNPDDSIASLKQLDAKAAAIAAEHFYSAWIENDPPQALLSAISFSQEGPVADRFLYTVAAKWGRLDPAGALAWFAENSSRTSDPNLGLSIVTSAAGVDPKKTLEAVMQLPEADVGGFLRVAAVNAWVYQDADAAQVWLRQQPAGTASKMALEVARSAGQLTDIEVWLPFIEEMPPSSAQTTAYTNLMQRWAASSPTDAIRYLGQVGDANLTQSVYPSVLKGLAKSDPEFALTTALTLPEGPARANAVSTIAVTWSLSNPQQAISHILSLSDSDVRTSMIQSAAATWATMNPAAASKWVATLPENATRDNVLAAISSALSARDPAAALANANEIKNPVVRQGVLTRLRPENASPAR